MDTKLKHVKDLYWLRKRSYETENVDSRIPWKYENITEDQLERMNEDLWIVLSAKCEGDAHMKVMAGGEGEGLYGYILLHAWFTRTTDQGKDKLHQMIMNPDKCKHEWEIAGAIEKWEENYKRMLQQHGEIMKLHDTWRIGAIKKIICGKIESQVHMHSTEYDTYEKLRKDVMGWAENIRAVHERSPTQGIAPMDIGELEQNMKKLEEK